MFSRIFSRPGGAAATSNGTSNGNGSQNGNRQNHSSQPSTPDTSSREDPSNHGGEIMQEPQVEEHQHRLQPPDIPSTPLIPTTDGKTVVRLYVEILGCDNLGPDFTKDGHPVKKIYHPYVKVKLGGNDDKNSLDIHKTKPVQQRFNTRDPIFDYEVHDSFFCIDGLSVDDLAKGLMLKVKDAKASSKKKNNQDVLGWALAQPGALLWRNLPGRSGGGGGMDDTSASHLYEDIDLDYTLEYELVHPTELVTGLAGTIHIICRPATEEEVDICRTKGSGYFKPYTPAASTATTASTSTSTTPSHQDVNMNGRATTPPLHEVL